MHVIDPPLKRQSFSPLEVTFSHMDIAKIPPHKDDPMITSIHMFN